jgi:hypothetical protein
MNLDEPVSESKKVTDFLKGIRDPVLNTGKSIVLGDPGKLGNFEECQQYLSTIGQNLAAQSESERNVSSVSTDANGKSSSSLFERSREELTPMNSIARSRIMIRNVSRNCATRRGTRRKISAKAAGRSVTRKSEIRT